jgi:hypothetical protein
MSPTETERRPDRGRVSISRRRFFHRGLTVGVSGLLALFGLTEGDDREDERFPSGSGHDPASSRDLAG